MDFKKLFSLKSRATFFMLVASLCLFSVSSWWSVRMLVNSEIKGRLESEGDRVATAVAGRLQAGGAVLTDLRAHFLTTGTPGAPAFRSFLENLDLFARFPGIQLFGYANELGRRGPRSKVIIAEPMRPSREERAGRNLLNDETILTAARKSRETNSVVMAEASNSIALLLDLPGRRSGLVYAVVSLPALVEASLSRPDFNGEAVNFRITARTGKGSASYVRFPDSEQGVMGAQGARRIVPIFGGELVVEVFPLEGFYSFADRYLALIVGFGAALLSCLIMVVMRVSQSQLELEILAKEASMEAALRGRREIENLRKLNQLDRELAGEISMSALLEKFFSPLEEIMQADGAALFFTTKVVNPRHLSLQHQRGLESAGAQSFVSVAWMKSVFAGRSFVRPSDPGAMAAFRRVVEGNPKFSDWLMMQVSTREIGHCGLVLLVRKNGMFSEVDRELLESVVSNFASSVEIAQLFSRVEDAARAKNAFLANMSHEIRTPLSAIIGFSEILTEEKVTPERKQALAQSIRKNGEQLTCIIDDILDLSKVEAGKLRIEKRRVRLSSIMKEIRSVMDPRAAAKGIGLRIEGQGKLPSHIETDEVRLKQILMNLLGNAIKFTEQGTVSLKVSFGGPDSKTMVFSVIDTGVGISEEGKARLFRPFSQGDDSTTRRYGGSGLGLALSRRLAQELGGDITLVESSRGRGSTFELSVAAGDLQQASWSHSLFITEAPQPERPTFTAPPLQGCKILLVEDSEDNQQIFRHFLDSCGAETSIVGNGLQAVKQAAGGSYDMILMDIQIPGIDGKEATRRIRQHGYAKPIVALTAHAMAEEKESCMRAGCNGQITKPVSGEALVLQIAEYLGRA